MVTVRVVSHLDLNRIDVREGRGRHTASDDHDGCNDGDGDDGAFGEGDGTGVCASATNVVVALGGGIVAYPAGGDVLGVVLLGEGQGRSEEGEE